MSRPAPILFQDLLVEYDFGKDHPFNGDRFKNFPLVLEENLEKGDYQLLEAEPVSKKELFRVADENYVEFTRDFFNSPEKERDSSNFDRYHSRDNFPGRRSGKLEKAARGVLGQAKEASDLVAGESRKAISIGGGFHHAKPRGGEGFCIYNDVAYAARYLLEEKGANRVMILDTDAHAGNGTYEYFSEESEVLQVDIHQDPSTIYPGTGYVTESGKATGKGYTINVPMPEKAGDRSYQRVFEEIVFPVALEFSPSIIIRNGGSDPFYGDPLTNLGLSMKGLQMIGRYTEKLRSELDCGLIDLIVSGYSGESLHRGWFALISGLIGQETGFSDSESPDEKVSETENIIQKVKNAHKGYWNF